MSRGDMRVAEGHADIRVPEELLDSADVDAFHHEAGSKCVAEIMPAEIADVRPFDGRREYPVHEVLRVQSRLAGRARKDPLSLQATRQRTKDLSHTRVHRDAPCPPCLRPRNREDVRR